MVAQEPAGQNIVPSPNAGFRFGHGRFDGTHDAPKPQPNAFGHQWFHIPRTGRHRPLPPSRLDHQALHRAPEIAALVGEPRHGETGAVGTDPGFRIGTGDDALRRRDRWRPSRRSHHSVGSTASAYSRLKRAISSAAGTILPTLPTPCPLPQISFQALGLARSPEASVPKLIFEASDSGRLSGSNPAATMDGFR